MVTTLVAGGHDHCLDDDDDMDVAAVVDMDRDNDIRSVVRRLHSRRG